MASTSRIRRKWVGPFRIRDLLADVHGGSVPRAPQKGSAYLVTRRCWMHIPTAKCEPLYVGGITGGSPRFRTRLGDLVADMFGFFGTTTGHHSGGRSLFQWCKKHEVNPMQLQIAWVKHTHCHRCLEVALVGELKPVLNRKLPARCPSHG